MFGRRVWLSLAVVPVLLIAQRSPIWPMRISTPESVLVLCAYAVAFLIGITVVDGGDTPGSIASVASAMFGMSTNASGAASAILALFLAAICIAIMVLMIVRVILERAELKRAALEVPFTQPGYGQPPQPPRY